jgi:hypothetical protein
VSCSFGALDIFIGLLLRRLPSTPVRSLADIADERQRVDFLELVPITSLLETLRLLVVRWDFEFAPSAGPRGAKAVFGDGGIRVAGIDV